MKINTMIAFAALLTLPALGQVGAAIAPMAEPLVLAATNNNWSISMGLFALSYFLGAICWAFINSDERLHSSKL